MLGFFSEIAFGSGGDAVVTVTKINAVDVKFENSLLGLRFASQHRFEVFLDALSEKHLSDFPAHRPVFQLKAFSGQLLGDRRGSLIESFRPHAVIRRTYNTVVVDSVVIVKAAVLRCEKGIDEMSGNLFQLDGASVLDKDTSHFLAIPVKYPAGYFDILEISEIKGMGKVIARLAVEKGSCRADKADDEEDYQHKAGKLEPEKSASSLIGALRFFIANGRQINHGFAGQRWFSAAVRFEINVVKVVRHGMKVAKRLKEG